MKITLIKNNDFWQAFGADAYLFVTQLWPDIKVLLVNDKKEKKEIAKIGFIYHSLKKVFILAEEKNLTVAGFINDTNTIPLNADNFHLITDLQIGKLIIGEFAFVAADYQRWQNDYCQLKTQVQKQMEPFYGKLPTYKESYDLFNLVVSAHRNFPRELQLSLGEKLINLILDNNLIFRRICLATVNQEKKTLIDTLQTNFEQMLFLLRLSFNQHAINLDRNVLLTSKILDITKQLKIWKSKYE